MQRILILACCALLVLTGCVTDASARRQAREAYLAGLRQEAEDNAAKAKGPCVIVRGNVKNRIIPWTEKITLAEVILAADDQNLMAPSKFLLTRGNRTMEITVRQLLDGNDIPLESGDIVNIVH
jgi:hypothetical protein